MKTGRLPRNVGVMLFSWCIVLLLAFDSQG